MLQAKWQALKNALRIGDISGALSFAVQARPTEFQKIFQNLTVSLPSLIRY